MTAVASTRIPSRRTLVGGRESFSTQMKRLHPALRTDVLLAILLASTVLSFTFEIAGRPISLTELIIIPVLFALLFSPERAQLPHAFFGTTLIYLLWCTLALGWSDDFTQSVGTLIQYVEFFLLVPLAFMYVRTLRGVVAILNTYLIAATLLSLMAVGFAIATRTFSYLYFLDYQKNALGAITANAIMVSVGLMILSAGARRWYVIALLANAGALFFSSSRGSMLGVVAGLIVFLLLIRRIRYGIVLTIFGGALVWVYTAFIDPEASTTLTDFSADSSAGSRWAIWDHAAEFIAQSPMVGHGVGTYSIRIPSIGFQQADPSNVFLLNLAEVGVVGLVIFCILLLVITVHAIRNARIFRENWAYLILSAGLMAAFASHIAHIQIDVAWVRGTGVFAFACVGLLFKLRQLHVRDESAGTLPRLRHQDAGS